MALMAIPTTALVIAFIFAVTNDMKLIATPMADNTIATDQAQPFPLIKPYATTSDSMPSGLNIVHFSSHKAL
jgi:hypothetical protein